MRALLRKLQCYLIQFFMQIFTIKTLLILITLYKIHHIGSILIVFVISQNLAAPSQYLKLSYRIVIKYDQISQFVSM